MSELTEQDVQKAIAEALKAQNEATLAAQEAAKARQVEIDAEATKKFEAMKSDYVKRNRLPDYDGVAPYATKFNDSKFDNLTAADMSVLVEVERARGIKPSETAVKSLAYKMHEEKATSAQHEKDLRYMKSALNSAGLGSVEAVKAAEVMATSDTGNGLEWIGTAYATELWRSIRHDGGIVGRIPEVVIPNGYSSEYFPLEDADPTWYTVAQTTDANATTGVPDASIPSSKAGTGQKQLTLTKKGARSLFSGELTEDSLIQFAPQLREQMMVSGRELMEAFVINADSETGATANINDIAGTPASTDWFLGGNGFRKLALVTNTANSRSGTTLTVEDYLETLKLMGTAGLAAADISKVMFVVDPNTYFKTQELTEVKSRDYGNAVVVENGFVTRLYGIPLLPSWQMHKGATTLKANAAGKVDLDTQGNNTTGSILCVRPDQWKLGYKRRMTMEVTRFANSDSWEIVALARFGIAYRDTEASAISYNITV